MRARKRPRATSIRVAVPADVGARASASDPRQATIARFAAAAEADPLVIAAFVGGSIAAGTADQFSDLDLYVVSDDAQYDAFFARRAQFMARWSKPVFLDVTVNFEGFGFDMVHFVLADGVCGEIALGRRSNVLALHGGPYDVLVDEFGLLEGVTFPLYQPSADEEASELARSLTWFWLDVIALAKALGRGRLAAAHDRLASMRGRCATLVAAAGVDDALDDARLLATYVPADRVALAAAARALVALHRDAGATVAAARGLQYPDELAAVATAHLERAT